MNAKILNSETCLNELVNNFDYKFFKTMGEPVRLDILRFLMTNGRSDIGTIAENMPQDRSVISRHLTMMQESGILNSFKETRYVYYEINGKAFIDKLEAIANQIRECMRVCCPECCK
jgi:DNA-binding transcriptional ArsR family regulator